MGVNDKVNVIRRQSACLQTRHHVGVSCHGLARGDVTADRLRIPVDISAQAKVEHNACRDLSRGVDVLH